MCLLGCWRSSAWHVSHAVTHGPATSLVIARFTVSPSSAPPYRILARPPSARPRPKDMVRYGKARIAWPRPTRCCSVQYTMAFA
ncbi:hypothetical protein IWX91DRAFT_181997 [Phyllosticta citricarpa]